MQPLHQSGLGSRTTHFLGCATLDSSRRCCRDNQVSLLCRRSQRSLLLLALELQLSSEFGLLLGLRLGHSSGYCARLAQAVCCNVPESAAIHEISVILPISGVDDSLRIAIGTFCFDDFFEQNRHRPLLRFLLRDLGLDSKASEL